MQSKASFAREPIRSILVHSPIALWTMSVITDVIFHFYRNASLLRMSKVLIVAGIGGAILAAIPGIVDWWRITDPVVKRVANWHVFLNIAAPLIFATSLCLRMENYGARIVGPQSKIPLAVSVVGWLVMAISARLGGKLAHEHSLADRDYLNLLISRQPIVGVNESKTEDPVRSL